MTRPERARWIAETVKLALRLPFDSDSSGVLADRCLAFAGETGGHSQTMPWVIMDGPTAVGKDTQICLLSAALRQHGYRVAEVDGRGGGTRLGPLLEDLIEHNRRHRHPRQWHADYQLKAAAWSAVRQSTAITAVDFVLCNRGPLSQLAYSAVSMNHPDLLHARAPGITQQLRPTDLSILLTCPDHVLIARARDRSARGDKAARPVDTPQFIAAISRALQRLGQVVPGVNAIDGNADRDDVFRAILALTMDTVAHVPPRRIPGPARPADTTQSRLADTVGAHGRHRSPANPRYGLGKSDANSTPVWPWPGAPDEI